MKLTAIIEREGAGYVALCPELDIASQGDDVSGARNNLREAVELFLECASSKEVQHRFSPKKPVCHCAGCSKPNHKDLTK